MAARACARSPCADSAVRVWHAAGQRPVPADAWCRPSSACLIASRYRSIADRCQSLCPACPSDQRAVIDVRPYVHAARARSSAASSRPRSKLALAIRPHSAPARRVQISGLSRISPAVDRRLNAGAVTGAWRVNSGNAGAADIRTRQPHNVSGELLHCRWADFGDRRFLCVLASFSRRQGDHVQPVIITAGRQGTSGHMDQGSPEALLGDQRERERGNLAGRILTLAADSGFDLVVNLSERSHPCAELRLRLTQNVRGTC